MASIKADGYREGETEGEKNGVKKGQDDLASTIRRLRLGESSEVILASGIDKRTLEIARDLV